MRISICLDYSPQVGGAREEERAKYSSASATGAVAATCPTGTKGSVRVAAETAGVTPRCATWHSRHAASS